MLGLQLASLLPLSPLTTIVRCLVGHTVEEVQRELILCSLSHYCGNRTCAAKVLGISVRTMRNKINEYAAQGIAVPEPGQNQTSTSTETTKPNLSTSTVTTLDFTSTA
jgi:Bacterial regulatory protein, Fis family